MANDFSGDPSCKAVWRFENGALTADSKGANTLTAVNSPTADTSLYKEGGASVNLATASHQFFKIADANLSRISAQERRYPQANHRLPLGETYVAVRLAGLGGQAVLWSSSTAVGLEMNGSTLYLKYNGVDISTGITLAINNFYHIGLAIDGVNKAVTSWWSRTATGPCRTGAIPRLPK